MTSKFASHMGLFIRATNKRQNGRCYHAESRTRFSNGTLDPIDCHLRRRGVTLRRRCRRRRRRGHSRPRMSLPLLPIHPMKFSTMASTCVAHLRQRALHRFRVCVLFAIRLTITNTTKSWRSIVYFEKKWKWQIERVYM